MGGLTSANSTESAVDLLEVSCFASAAAGPSSAANGSAYNPSETDCVNVAQQPGRHAPDDLSACGITAPIGGYGYCQPRG
jgi:hypothetical protein